MHAPRALQLAVRLGAIGVSTLLVAVGLVPWWNHARGIPVGGVDPLRLTVGGVLIAAGVLGVTGAVANRARPLLAAAGATATAWALFAAWRFGQAYETALVANALAGDLAQSAAALVLVAGPLAAAAWVVPDPRRGIVVDTARAGLVGFSVLLAGLVAATMALGMPWHGIGPFPLGAGLLLAAGVSAAWAVRSGGHLAWALAPALLALAWALHAARLVAWAEGGREVWLVTLSYAVPQALLLAPAALALQAGRARKSGPIP